MKSVESVTVLVLANTGSRYEQTDQHGTAHFFEHMVFKGTQNFPTAQILSRAVDGVGADFNAFTSKEYTGYYVKTASDHLDLALSVVSDMLLRPLLRQEDIDREKGVIVEEMNMYADNPASHIANLFDQMVYRGSGLSHNLVGEKETVTQQTQADFRQFLQQWYGLGNLILVLAGDEKVVNDTHLLSKVNDYFSEKDVVDRQPTAKISPYLVSNPISQEKLHVELKETQQAHLVLGWPGISRKSDQRYILSVLSVILGGNMSSRLFTEVREKRGLCYYVHTDVDYFHDGGLFGGSAGVDPSRFAEALKVMVGEFRQLADGRQPVSTQELQMAKDYVMGKMVLGFEDSESLAQFFGMRLLLQGKTVSPEEMETKIKAVTLDQVQALAKQLILPDELRLAVIGPFKKLEVEQALTQALA